MAMAQGIMLGHIWIVVVSYVYVLFLGASNMVGENKLHMPYMPHVGTYVTGWI